MRIKATIDKLVIEGNIPFEGKFEVTEKLMEDYYYTYKLLFGTTDKGTNSSSNTKFARRLAGLNLLRENISRGVKATEISAGHVYLISNPAFPVHYKVGVSYDVHRRLAQYQTYSPYRDFVLDKYDFVLNKFKTEQILLNHPLLNKASGEWVKKENAVTVFDDLARSHISTYN